ncbi:CPBP family intramembrane glutamic endopeptidase [Bacillus sp. 03113]|uniref:CPBP family intramembrane glutamic endopeptidase n=1 Tax=Bacillus sp. 03113 TaxID=2578211 RepID=UPI001144C230|nr:type II CAAX endopeptidase family protein [Bacillus sp. 03113]
MKTTSIYQLIVGIILAHLLIFFTFHEITVFWYIFTFSMLLLISFSILYEQMEHKASFLIYFSYGIISGTLLFVVFKLGSFLIEKFNLPFLESISRLYALYEPTQLWQYLALFLIIIPGEEIFWRGYIQKKLISVSNAPLGIIFSSFLYASIQIYSGYLIHVLSAIVAGLLWGFLYYWKKSLSLVILSHLVFDFFLIVVFPLNQ